jgi:hypothetical protein
MSAALRFSWCFVALIVLANAVILRGRFRHLVASGRLIESDARRVNVLISLALLLPTTLLGVINLWAVYPNPICSLTPFLFVDVVSTTTAIIIAGWWTAFLILAWCTDVPQTLVRVSAALSASSQRRTSWTVWRIRIAITGMIALSAVRSIAGRVVLTRTLSASALCSSLAHR